jgi:hypothetical protein
MLITCFNLSIPFEKSLEIVLILRVPRTALKIWKSSLTSVTDRELSPHFSHPKRKKFGGTMSWLTGREVERLRRNSSILAKFHYDTCGIAFWIGWLFLGKALTSLPLAVREVWAGWFLEWDLRYRRVLSDKSSLTGITLRMLENIVRTLLSGQALILQHIRGDARSSTCMAPF